MAALKVGLTLTLSSRTIRNRSHMVSICQQQKLHSGGIALAALYSVTQDVARSIQEYRNFSTSLEQYVQRVALAQVRFSRWGSSVKLNDLEHSEYFDIASPVAFSENEIQTIVRALIHTLELYEKITKDLMSYEMKKLGKKAQAKTGSEFPERPSTKRMEKDVESRLNNAGISPSLAARASRNISPENKERIAIAGSLTKVWKRSKFAFIGGEGLATFSNHYVDMVDSIAKTFPARRSGTNHQFAMNAPEPSTSTTQPGDSFPAQPYNRLQAHAAISSSAYEDYTNYLTYAEDGTHADPQYTHTNAQPMSELYSTASTSYTTPRSTLPTQNIQSYFPHRGPSSSGGYWVKALTSTKHHGKQKYNKLRLMKDELCWVADDDDEALYYGHDLKGLWGCFEKSECVWVRGN